MSVSSPTGASAEQEGIADESKLRSEIASLEAELADLQARLPAHSIPPAMIMVLDELEDRLAEARSRLGAQQEPR